MYSYTQTLSTVSQPIGLFLLPFRFAGNGGVDHYTRDELAGILQQTKRLRRCDVFVGEERIYDDAVQEQITLPFLNCYVSTKERLNHLHLQHLVCSIALLHRS